MVDPRRCWTPVAELVVVVVVVRAAKVKTEAADFAGLAVDVLISCSQTVGWTALSQRVKYPAYAFGQDSVAVGEVAPAPALSQSAGQCCTPVHTPRRLLKPFATPVSFSGEQCGSTLDTCSL